MFGKFVDLWLWTLFKVGLILLSAGVCCHVVQFMVPTFWRNLVAPFSGYL